MKRSKTLKMTLCALFAALTAVLSQIVIPIGPVPINLATFAVFLAGALLGSKLGAASLATWAALGIAGVPVFTMMRSGPGTLLGPTGGFIFGYIAAAYLIGLVVEKTNRQNRMYLYAAAMSAGALCYFAPGVLWFMFSTGTGLFETLTICVFPFIPGDIIKLIVAATLAKRLRPFVNR